MKLVFPIAQFDFHFLDIGAPLLQHRLLFFLYIMFQVSTFVRVLANSFADRWTVAGIQAAPGDAEGASR